MTAQDPQRRALPSPTDDAVDSAVRDVFAADRELAEALAEMRHVVDAPPQERSEGWFERLWASLFDGLEGLRVDAPILYWLLIAGLVVVLVLLLVHIGWTLSTAIRDYRAPDAPRDEEQVARRRRHAEWLAEAREHAARGDVRTAVRMLVLSLLALLEERHVMTYAASWTTREILDRLGARIGRSPAIATFGAGVERASYGAAVPARDEFDRLETAMLDLSKAADAAGEDEQ